MEFWWCMLAVCFVVPWWCAFSCWFVWSLLGPTYCRRGDRRGSWMWQRRLRIWSLPCEFFQQACEGDEGAVFGGENLEKEKLEEGFWEFSGVLKCIGVVATGGDGGHEDAIEDSAFFMLEVVEEKYLWWNQKNLLYRKICHMPWFGRATPHMHGWIFF